MSADSATVEIEVVGVGAFCFSVLFAVVFDGIGGNWDEARESDDSLLLDSGDWLDRWFFIPLLSEFVGVNAIVNKVAKK